MKLTGAEIIVETLIEQQTKVVFGYPGGQVLNIYDALYTRQDRISHIITAHEQGAAHAADGYARATGAVGVCLATSGPGATNLVTGIATAHLDSTPLVAITGNVPCSLLGRDSFQEVDIMGVTLPITKHNYIVKDVNRLADTIREAFRIAKSGRPGPVLIDVPKDIQLAVCDYEPQPVIQPAPLAPADEHLAEQAVQMLAEAKRPYIYCGGGVIHSGAAQEVLALAERLDAPVGCSLMGLSAIPYDSPYALGMQGMHGHYASSKAKAESDLIVAVGARFSDRATGDKAKYSDNKKILHIDIDPAEVNKNIPVYLGIVGDVKTVLTSILNKLKPQHHPTWMTHIAQLKAEQYALDKPTNALTPARVIKAFNRKETGIVATDVGQHQMWAAQYCRFQAPRTFITSGGLGTMGFGMGAAIGACIATGKKTVLFTGDGSFGMNLNELATAVSNNLPLVIVILNNGVLGMVRQWQTLFFNRHYSSTTLGRKTDFVKLAEAFGAKGLRVSDAAELDGAVQTAVDAGGPVVIDCVIDQDEFVLPMIPPGGSIDSMMIKRGDK